MLGQDEIASLLIKQKANIHAQGEVVYVHFNTTTLTESHLSLAFLQDGKTPLAMASRNGCSKIVSLLMAEGANTEDNEFGSKNI